jgi:hypothetical protein
VNHNTLAIPPHPDTEVIVSLKRPSILPEKDRDKVGEQLLAALEQAGDHNKRSLESKKQERDDLKTVKGIAVAILLGATLWLLVEFVVRLAAQ